jgi:hypothetical protein
MVEEAKPVPLPIARAIEMKPERFAFDFEVHRKDEWYQVRVHEWLTKLEQSGIKIGSYQLTSES